MSNANHTRRGHTTSPTAIDAASEFYHQVVQDDLELVLFFCSSLYDLDVLASELNRLFSSCPVIGCTTAGEIGPEGYVSHSLTGVSFSKSGFTAAHALLTNLKDFELRDGQKIIADMHKSLQARHCQISSQNTFAILLIDGLSVREEPVTHALQSGLGDVAMIGGSAGDDLKFQCTQIFYGGQFVNDSAVVVLINTIFPFKQFKTQHFVSSELRMVVTEADASKRLVKELNGRPAALEYAKLIGVDVKALGPILFAASPVVVLIDSLDYVRSIQRVNDDLSLTFFCAIEEGLVLRVAQGVDLVQNLVDTFQSLQDEIGPPQLVIGCDCILRNLEITQQGIKPLVSEILRSRNTIGFSTYGEQFGGVHINQTFTGLAIGSSPRQQND